MEQEEFNKYSMNYMMMQAFILTGNISFIKKQ